jgi:hypothetical protein
MNKRKATVINQISKKETGSMESEGAIAKIIHSWGNIFRFLFASVVIVMVIVLGLHCSVQLVQADLSDSLSRVEMLSDGRLNFMIRKGSQEELVITSLCANSPDFVTTGVILDANDKVKIKARGKIHLALDRLVRAIDMDLMLKYGWITPEGDLFRFGKDKTRDHLRKKFLAYRGDSIGQIIFFLRQTNEDLPVTVADMRKIYGADKIFQYREGDKKYMEIENKTDQECELMMAINDIIQDESNDERLAYTGTKASFTNDKGVVMDTIERNKYDSRVLRRDTIVEQRKKYFYDDNIGEFTLTLETEKQGFWTRFGFCSK